MSRRVFFSFHYKPDNWRAAQIRNLGVLSGNRPATDNGWETVKRGGVQAIRAWIDQELEGRTCTIVLIGENTAGRKWINYEIKKSWTQGKGLLGIYIHNLHDASGNRSPKGANPFSEFTMNDRTLSRIIKVYDPPFSRSRSVYNHIAENVEGWIEEAIAIRRRFK